MSYKDLAQIVANKFNISVTLYYSILKGKDIPIVIYGGTLSRSFLKWIRRDIHYIKYNNIHEMEINVDPNFLSEDFCSYAWKVSQKLGRELAWSCTETSPDIIFPDIRFGINKSVQICKMALPICHTHIGIEKFRVYPSDTDLNMELGMTEWIVAHNYNVSYRITDEYDSLDTFVANNDHDHCKKILSELGVIITINYRNG